MNNLVKNNFISNKVRLFNVSLYKKKGETLTHDIYYCPFCLEKRGKKDTKGKFYFDRIKKIGYCFLCESVGVLNIENKNLSEYKLELVISSIINKFNNSFKNDEITFQIMQIDKIFDNLDKNSKEYLISRLSLYEELFDILPMFSCSEGVIFPIYYNNECISYIIRYFNNCKMKYYIGTSTKFIYSPNNIFVNKNKVEEITIVEGVFDSIGAILNGYKNPIAILGKTVTEYQINFIRKLCPNIINIYLDKYELSNNLKLKIKNKFPFISKINIIKSFGDDPEEIYIKYLNNSKIDINTKLTNFNNGLMEIKTGNGKIIEKRDI